MVHFHKEQIRSSQAVSMDGRYEWRSASRDFLTITSCPTSPYPTSLLLYIPPTLHPSYPTSLLSYIPPILHPSYPTSLLSYIPPTLHPSYSTSLLPYIPPTLHPSYSTSLLPYIPLHYIPLPYIPLPYIPLPSSLLAFIPPTLPCTPPTTVSRCSR